MSFCETSAPTLPENVYDGFTWFTFNSAECGPPRTNEDGKTIICVTPLFRRPRSSCAGGFRRMQADQGGAADPSQRRAGGPFIQHRRHATIDE